MDLVHGALWFLSHNTQRDAGPGRIPTGTLKRAAQSSLDHTGCVCVSVTLVLRASPTWLNKPWEGIVFFNVYFFMILQQQQKCYKCIIETP